MAAREQISREEEFLIDQEPFRSNALLLINKMLDLNNQVRHEALVDEILHSIFFFGKLRKPSVSPESILSHDEMFNDLKRRFPEPFKLYSSQLPRRSPFSCVLDMIVLLLGRQKETDIIGRLRKLIEDLKPDESRDLVPSTICVSNKTDNKDQVKYYGVSMSAPGHYPRRFMIAASCLSSWDRYVAGAVMTYFPKNKKKPDFDGTIKLPQHVRCQAFDLLHEKDKPPCRSCANMFGLETDEKKEWVYGNCAEVESLSNLFKNEVDVKDQARPKPSKMYSDEKRERVENVVMADLRNLLKDKKWNFTWNDEFYPPQ
ncbi:uncharacterized protein LOC142931370 [Anarhichas minor]|uniref:uncharacterized protein LOC142931370 n=1 Tax=Anarhichas minor TaxID=65739 RepID=UPI003F73835A